MRMDKKEYAELVEQTAPKTKEGKTILLAFAVGGLICVIGQAISDALGALLPQFGAKNIAALTGVAMIFLGSLLTGLGVYDKIGYYAGAGSVLPITGFANSIVSPAIEYNKEGIVFGLMAKMFSIAGPVIVSGISASVLIGIVYYIIGLF
ncbi:MAG TPA: SpoVA/SpoVAEb family sporulation membrane protein [Candidatus Ornithoclostridium faecavium]|nr:SpoVA/SpoVAEb family sporulation membrane protein [Candidatus Ornithoclostridium faecavium]